jgi:preprotein translocase SecE subunit
MFKFLRDAQAELEHVVWPTPNETKKYMMYNVIVIIAVTALLMVLGYLIQTGLVAIRGQFDHEAPILETTTSDTVTQ